MVLYILFAELFPFSITYFRPLLQLVKITLNSHPVFWHFGNLAGDMNLISIFFLSSFQSLKQWIVLSPGESYSVPNFQCKAASVTAILLYGFLASFIPTWFLFSKLFYKDNLQNWEKAAQSKDVLHFCLSSFSRPVTLSLKEWRDEMICHWGICNSCSSLFHLLGVPK